MQKISIAYTYTKERSFLHVMNFMKCKDDHISKRRSDNNIVTSFFLSGAYIKNAHYHERER